MSKLKPPRTSRGTLATTVLGTLCAAGAVFYGAAVGVSLLPTGPVDPGTDHINTVSGLSAIPKGPVGELQIQVSDQARAYVQNVTCTGVVKSDPEPCAELAEQIEAEDEGNGATQGAENPFTEVSKGAVCTDLTYGPQTAVVTGTWEGEKVDTELSREGSCEEARWQRLTPVTDPLS